MEKGTQVKLLIQRGEEKFGGLERDVIPEDTVKGRTIDKNDKSIGSIQIDNFEKRQRWNFIAMIIEELRKEGLNPSLLITAKFWWFNRRG